MPLHALRAAAILAAHMPAPVKTSAAAPERSLDQRMDALKRANDIRTARARLKKDLKAGKVQIERLLIEPPEYLGSAKVFDLMLAVPKYGRVKVNRILNQCRISPSKTIGGLSVRQRAELVALLRRERRSSPPSGRFGLSSSAPPWLQSIRDHRPHRGRQGNPDHASCSSACPNLELSISATTREPRQGEQDGATTTSSPRRSSTGATRDDFLEFAAYSGNRYGTLRSEVERRLDDGHSVVLEIEVQGPARCARHARLGPDLHRPARPGRPAQRLEGRGTDSAEAIDARLETAENELAAQGDFDHRIVNDDLDRAAGELEEIVRAEAGLPLDSRPNDQTTRRQTHGPRRLAVRRGRRRCQAGSADQQLLPQPR